MSFILDALRKSDQQRQRSATPTLMTAQVPAESARQPALFWYGLLAVVLLAAGILIGWLHQWQAEPTAPVVQASVNRQQPASMPQYAVPPSPAAVMPEPVRKPETPPAPREPVAPVTVAATQPAPVAVTPPAPVAAPPKLATAQPEPSVSKPVPPTPAITAQVPASPPKQEERGVATEAAKDPVVMAMAELPPMIQQELPKLAILAHSYSSKPKARFVFINDRMVHEEESPAPGLKLEQITPDGMIFSYKGYRFRRAANQ